MEDPRMIIITAISNKEVSSFQTARQNVAKQTSDLGRKPRGPNVLPIVSLFQFTSNSLRGYSFGKARSDHRSREVLREFLFSITCSIF